MQFNTCWGTSLLALYLKRFLTFLFVITAGPLGLAVGATVLSLYVALLVPVMIPAYVSCPRPNRFVDALRSFSHAVTFGAASTTPAGPTASMTFSPTP
jgi:hypothetical protein